MFSLVAPRTVLTTERNERTHILKITLFNGTFLLTDLKNNSTRSGPFSQYSLPIDLEGIISETKKISSTERR